MPDYLTLSRRSLLRLSAAAALGSTTAMRGVLAADGVRELSLEAREAQARLAPHPFPETAVWSYDGVVPGPEIRLQRGEPVRIRVRNSLTRPTTVHWHGLRIANAADGVPNLTQPPIMPGEEFLYEFTPPDAGTFWYHSHVDNAEQVGRGLHGPLVVEDQTPYAVDRELTWVLGDWRLNNDASIKDDFLNSQDFARAGRIGSTITVNGRAPQPVTVRSGERIRLRLVNVANARIFSLRFERHEPTVIALDGQAVEPYVPRGGAIQLAPAQRVDVVLDLMRSPGERLQVIDSFYPQSPYKLLDLVYSDESRLRTGIPPAVPSLVPNAIPVPDLRDGQIEDVLLEGGDLGHLSTAQLKGRDVGMSELFMLGKMWAMNGIAGFRTTQPPIFTVPLGKTCVLSFRNHTAWPHPMHLHGHHFQIVEHAGDETLIGKWQDTVLLGPGENAKVAFVADNPGDWLFHCHILSHAEAGMLAVVRVA